MVSTAITASRPGHFSSAGSAQVRHRPDSSAHTSSVRVVKHIKEIVRIAPREIVLDLLMKVLGNSCIGLFVIVLECQEVVAALVQDLRSNGRLTAHRING